MMQYLHTRTYKNHMILIKSNWVITQSQNIIHASTLNHYVYNGLGFPKLDTYFDEPHAGIVLK